MSRAARLLFIGLLLPACSQEMDNQPKYKTYRPTSIDWSEPAQQPVAGTIARGQLPQPIPESLPLPLTPALLAHGRERFNVYCSPCHSELGDGDGRVVRRGFPAPPSYHSPRLRAVSDAHIYHVITNGHGIMYSYAARVPPPDRWAIVAYIRALQLSQHAPAALLPAQERSP
jgi:mono/diheme cytochrome c family protein